MNWLEEWYKSLSTAQKFVVNALLVLSALYGAVYGVPTLLKSSQERAIAACQSELSQTSQAADPASIEQQCQSMCQSGELSGCK